MFNSTSADDKLFVNTVGSKLSQIQNQDEKKELKKKILAAIDEKLYEFM